MHVRRPIHAVLALGWCLLAANSAPGRAEETFLCDDGSSVTIDGDNREAMQDHPCVKAWFAGDLARRQGRAEGVPVGPDPQPVVRRTTINSAAASRDLRYRPAYLAWSRARTLQVRSAAPAGATPVRAYIRSPVSKPLGVTIRVPVGRR